MPYIRKDARKIWDESLKPIIDPINDGCSVTPGEFNYLISKILWAYFIAKPCYTRINEIVGVLECIKLEFYRRLGAKMEDEKILENGDLFK